MPCTRHQTGSDPDCEECFPYVEEVSELDRLRNLLKSCHSSEAYFIKVAIAKLERKEQQDGTTQW